MSESVALLEGAAENQLNPAGTPITFRLSCATLQQDDSAVAVYDNGIPLPFTALVLTPDSITVPSGIGSGRHQLALVARDIYGYTIESTVVLWAGTFTIPVRVLDEAGVPAAGVSVVAKLADDPTVATMVVTDATGTGQLSNLPNRSYNVVAQASGNRFATQPTSVFDGTVTLRLRGLESPSPIDNNDFSQGTAGWNIGTAPVSIVPHVQESPSNSPAGDAQTVLRTAEASAAAASVLQSPAEAGSTAENFDLALNTRGEGQQSISRSFTVEPGFKSVTVRYRFITSEVPGGYFGSEFNDFFNVSVRSAQGGSTIDGNSMNGLGLAAFDSRGATGWMESELTVNDQGDSVQVDVAVANVADGLFDSQVVVDIVQKKSLTISSVQLNDIDDQRLTHLSASGHTYFNGNTRVHGTITIDGPRDDSLSELTVEVLEGQRIAVGALATTVRPTLLVQFGDDERIQLGTSQLLFEIPAAQLAAANQLANGRLTLRVKARSSTGETAERSAASVTKLVRFTGGNRYGDGRDEAVGGDDWALPRVRSLIASAGLTWGDFSNMNGGLFRPHTTHQTGRSADGWFSGYNERNAATAATIIGHLNTHGTRIRSVYVTFAANSEFANAIAGVTLNDGRAATAVIRNIPSHRTHFHWEITD